MPIERLAVSALSPLTLFRSRSATRSVSSPRGPVRKIPSALDKTALRIEQSTGNCGRMKEVGGLLPRGIFSSRHENSISVAGYNLYGTSSFSDALSSHHEESFAAWSALLDGDGHQ